MGGEREPVPRGKKWPFGSFLAPDAQFIPGTSIVDEPVNLEHSDLNNFEVCLDVSKAVGFTIMRHYNVQNGCTCSDS